MDALDRLRVLADCLDADDCPECPHQHDHPGGHVCESFMVDTHDSTTARFVRSCIAQIEDAQSVRPPMIRTPWGEVPFSFRFRGA